VNDAAAPLPTAASPDGSSGLAARARGGDEAAFAALYRGCVDRTFRYLRLRVGDASLAADLTQDVWLNALKGIRDLGDPARFDAWLFAITRNRLRRHWDDRRRNPTAASIDADGDAAPLAFDDAAAGTSPKMDGLGASVVGEGVEAMAGIWRQAALVEAVTALSDRQREVIALRFGAGYSVLETADLLGRSEAAVKQLQHRALVELRARLQDKEMAR
jgi:RNA polymerase sigma-70 factor (ECF subfamily)